MGGWSLIQTRDFKAQELKMERSRLININDVGLLKAKNLLEEANQSRIYTLAAQGRSKSGSMEKWKQAVEGYKNTITALDLEQFQILGSAHFNKKFSLASQIQRLHLINEKINLILESLNKSVSEDDKARENLQKMRFHSDQAN